jgi:hypothetical protein
MDSYQQPSILREPIAVNCIYCANEANSTEHHLPFALGNFKGYVPLLHRVCSVCNGKCGKLDEQLSRASIEAWHRIRLGIEGRKSHEKVNPFYRGSSGGKPIEMTALNPTTGKTVPLELIGGNVVQELRHVTLTTEDGIDHMIRIPDKMTPEQFKKCVAELPVKKFKSADVSASEEEMEWVQQLILSGLTFEKRTDLEAPALGPILYGPTKIKVSGDTRYFRCIAKIGFHYFLAKMTQFRGDEPCFAGIRGLIIDEGSSFDDCARFISAWKSPLQDDERFKNSGHILSAEKYHSRLIARVRLFVEPASLGRIYRVELGCDPSHIYYSKWFADSFSYYPKDERAEFDGEVNELIESGDQTRFNSN